MTTTTSTSTSSGTTTGSTILNALNATQGLDTSNIVSQLVEAEFADKLAQLSTQNTQVTKQISDAGTLLSSINTFSSAVKSLVQGGSLTTQPISANSSVVSVSKLAGSTVSNLSANVEVRQLAAGQAAASDYVADASSATGYAGSGSTIGTGSFTLTFGTATTSGGKMTGFTAGPGTPITIAIDQDHATLGGIAAAINAANAGITATIIGDDKGARLMLKGATGASQAFTLQSNGGTDALSGLNVGVSSNATIGTAAADAIVALDGIETRRSSNTIDNLLTGVRLTLASAQPGTSVSITSSVPSSNLTQAVSNFVDTYNQLYSVLSADTDSQSGSLSRDSATRTLKTALSTLSTRPLVSGGAAGAPATLAELGVGTNRDGTLTLDTAKLSNAMLNYPDAVEAMFADGTQATGDGLSAALASIAGAAASTTYGLAASQATYTRQQGTIADQQAKIADQKSAETDRLTAQFTTMNTQVATYKSIQTFLTAQIDAWNNQNKN